MCLEGEKYATKQKLSGTWCNKEVGQPVCHRVRECVGQPVSQSVSLLANRSVGRSVGRLGR